MKQISTLIKPTHNCNMRCKYCFAEKYGYESSLLDINILKRYLELLTKKYKYINLVWHGGEPLTVPLDYYQEIYAYCKKLDSEFLYSLQTNGTLLNNDNIDFFKKNNTSIGLSFDGLTNDMTRTHSQIILRNIELLQSNGMYPGAILVVNQNNVNNLIAEYEYFKSLNLGMKMNPMFNDGAARKRDSFSLNPDEYIENFLTFFKYWALDTSCNINVSTCLELVNLVLNERSSVCTFNSCLGKWLCLDSNGHLYPCDRLCLDKYDLGNVRNMLSIDEAFENENFIKLLRYSISRRQDCIENCDFFKNCYGGCNANSILNEYNKNNVSCYIQKKILKGIKDFIIELDNQREYDKLNYSLSKILVRKDS